jgi:AcrR family transcriptional regulator
MNKNNLQANTTRQAILLAANQLVLAEGVGHLTLEAVAKKAGVSKGGLLYHFPSKEALIKGLIELLNARFEGEVARQLTLEHASQPREAVEKLPGSWLRAFVRATFAGNKLEGDWLGSSAAILTAIATDPQLLEPFRQSFANYQAQAEQDGLDPALATIIRLAADGLWLAELFELAPPGGELREQVERRLLEMTGKLPVGQAGPGDENRRAKNNI